MKHYKTLISTAFIALFLSCGKNPQADFTYSPSQPKAGQTVQFTNKSTEARSYSWNFGDMSIGKDENPSHIYNKSGDYIVDLTAQSGIKSDTKTATIHVQP
jgi:PKD repeat protein